jgi:hypothetical protein
MVAIKRAIARACIVIGFLGLVAGVVKAGAPGHHAWPLAFTSALSAAGAIGGGLLYLRSTRSRS